MRWIFMIIKRIHLRRPSTTRHMHSNFRRRQWRPRRPSQRQLATRSTSAWRPSFTRPYYHLSCLVTNRSFRRHSNQRTRCTCDQEDWHLASISGHHHHHGCFFVRRNNRRTWPSLVEICWVRKLNDWKHIATHGSNLLSGRQEAVFMAVVEVLLSSSSSLLPASMGVTRKADQSDWSWWFDFGLNYFEKFCSRNQWNWNRNNYDIQLTYDAHHHHDVQSPSTWLKSPRPFKCLAF